MGRTVAGLCLLAAGVATAAADVIFPRHAAAVADAPEEARAAIIAEERRKDGNYFPFESIPLDEVAAAGHNKDKMHGGVVYLDFEGKLKIEGNSALPREGEAGALSDVTLSEDEADAEAELQEADAEGETFEQCGRGGKCPRPWRPQHPPWSPKNPCLGCGRDCDKDVCGLEGCGSCWAGCEPNCEGVCNGPHGVCPRSQKPDRLCPCRYRYLSGRYVYVKGTFKRIRKQDGHGPRELEEVDEDISEAEDGPERMFQKSYKGYFPPPHPPVCTEVFKLVKFQITDGFLQECGKCWPKLKYRSQKDCTRDCSLTVDAVGPPPYHPCKRPFHVQMVLDYSKTMKQRRLDDFVKPLAIRVIDNAEDRGGRQDVGIAVMDDDIILALPLGESEYRDERKFIEDLLVTRTRCNLVDIARQVAEDYGGSQVLRGGHGAPKYPALLIMTHGCVVSEHDKAEFQDYLDLIYDTSNVVPVCMLIDNPSIAVQRDVALLCGCESPNNCPNLSTIDSTETEDIEVASRWIEKSLCRSQRRHQKLPFYSGAYVPRDGDTEADEYAEAEDEDGNKMFIVKDPFPLTDEDGNEIAAGQISAQGIVPGDLVAETRGGQTYDPYGGYAWQKPNKWNKWNKGNQNNYPYYPQYPQYGGDGGYGHYPEHPGYPSYPGYPSGHKPDVQTKTWSDTINLKNGKVAYGATITKIQGGNVDWFGGKGDWFNKGNKGYQQPYYPTHLPAQAPRMTFRVADMNAANVEGGIGYEKFYEGVTRKLAEAYQIPPGQLVACCGGNGAAGAGGSQFLKASAGQPLTYEVFVVDGDPNAEDSKSAMDVADRFRSLVGKDFTETGALGPYLSPRTTLSGLEVSDVAPYETALTQSLENMRGACGQCYHPPPCPPPCPPPPPPAPTAQWAYKVLNINLTLCAYYLKWNEPQPPPCYYRGKEAGDCLLAQAMTPGGHAQGCPSFRMEDTSGLDEEVVSALRELESISNNPTALEAIIREGGESLALFDLGGGLPPPLSGNAIRDVNGIPQWNLCPLNNKQGYKRPIRDAMRNVQQAIAV